VPICIPEDDKQLVGESAWVTGWGRLYEGETSCHTLCHALTSVTLLKD
jgi:hypothetical protein